MLFRVISGLGPLILLLSLFARTTSGIRTVEPSRADHFAPRHLCGGWDHCGKDEQCSTCPVGKACTRDTGRQWLCTPVSHTWSVWQSLRGTVLSLTHGAPAVRRLAEEECPLGKEAVNASSPDLQAIGEICGGRCYDDEGCNNNQFTNRQAACCPSDKFCWPASEFHWFCKAPKRQEDGVCAPAGGRCGGKVECFKYDQVEGLFQTFNQSCRCCESGYQCTYAGSEYAWTCEQPGAAISPAVSPELIPSPGASPQASPEMSPEMSPKMSPELSPGMSPEVSPGMSPGMSPEVSPGMSPDMSPGMSPEMSPGVSPEISPGMSPGVSPGVSPEVSPGLSPEMSPGVSPGMSPGVSPEMSPGMSPETSPEASPTMSPAMSPNVSPESSPPASPAPTSCALSGKLYKATGLEDQGDVCGGKCYDNEGTCQNLEFENKQAACCPEGQYCWPASEWHWFCKNPPPQPQGTCAPPGGRCGGKLECFMPDPNTGKWTTYNESCGCCSDGYDCVAQNEWEWFCLPPGMSTKEEFLLADNSTTSNSTSNSTDGADTKGSEVDVGTGTDSNSTLLNSTTCDLPGKAYLEKDLEDQGEVCGGKCFEDGTCGNSEFENKQAACCPADKYCWPASEWHWFCKPDPPKPEGECAPAGGRCGGKLECFKPDPDTGKWTTFNESCGCCSAGYDCVPDSEYEWFCLPPGVSTREEFLNMTSNSTSNSSANSTDSSLNGTAVDTAGCDLGLEAYVEELKAGQGEVCGGKCFNSSSCDNTAYSNKQAACCPSGKYCWPESENYWFCKSTPPQAQGHCAPPGGRCGGRLECFKPAPNTGLWTTYNESCGCCGQGYDCMYQNEWEWFCLPEGFDSMQQTSPPASDNFNWTSNATQNSTGGSPDNFFFSEANKTFTDWATNCTVQFDADGNAVGCPPPPELNQAQAEGDQAPNEPGNGTPGQPPFTVVPVETLGTEAGGVGGLSVDGNANTTQPPFTVVHADAPTSEGGVSGGLSVDGNGNTTQPPFTVVHADAPTSEGGVSGGLSVDGNANTTQPPFTVVQADAPTSEGGGVGGLSVDGDGNTTQPPFNVVPADAPASEDGVSGGLSVDGDGNTTQPAFTVVPADAPAPEGGVSGGLSVDGNGNTTQPPFTVVPAGAPASEGGVSGGLSVDGNANTTQPPFNVVPVNAPASEGGVSGGLSVDGNANTTQPPFTVVPAEAPAPEGGVSEGLSVDGNANTTQPPFTVVPAEAPASEGGVSGGLNADGNGNTTQPPLTVVPADAPTSVNEPKPSSSNSTVPASPPSPQPAAQLAGSSLTAPPPDPRFFDPEDIQGTSVGDGSPGLPVNPHFVESQDITGSSLNSAPPPPIIVGGDVEGKAISDANPQNTSDPNTFNEFHEQEFTGFSADPETSPSFDLSPSPGVDGYDAQTDSQLDSVDDGSEPYVPEVSPSPGAGPMVG